MTAAAPANLNTHSRRSELAYNAAAVLFAAVMVWRIVACYFVFTQVYDEPFHIACGMEWLDKHVYAYEAQHPPLSRIAAALGPYLAGERSHGIVNPIEEGNAILGDGARYRRNLALARLGELPFTILAYAAVWFWTRREFGRRAALFAALLFSMLPPILAHGGLATTDIAVTATCAWALYAFTRLLQAPSWKSSLTLGIWLGVALVSKFTAIPFFACGALVIFGIYAAARRKAGQTWKIPNGLRLICVSALLAAFIVWACYLFTFAPLFSAHELQVRSADFSPALTRPGLVHTVVTQIPVPAGQFFRGIGQVWRHNKGGQWSYLLGQRSDSGWWYFFPVVLAIKTPLGFLVLAAAGAVLMLGRLRYGDWRTAAPAIFAILVLLICMPGRLNIGVRHILPMYPMLSIAAGYCAAEWTGARGRLRKTLAAACVAWCCVASLRAHPDYLASFNEIASWRPEYFRVDSDLDWGQDLGRLRDRLRDLHATSVTLSYFGSADLTRFGLPPFTDITCDGQLHGYVAISATALYLGRPVWSGCPDRFYALQRMPSKRVGDSIFLYHFP